MGASSSPTAWAAGIAASPALLVAHDVVGEPRTPLVGIGHRADPQAGEVVGVEVVRGDADLAGSGPSTRSRITRLGIRSGKRGATVLPHDRSEELVIEQSRARMEHKSASAYQNASLAYMVAFTLPLFGAMAAFLTSDGQASIFYWTCAIAGALVVYGRAQKRKGDMLHDAEYNSARRRDASMLLLGGLAVMAMGAAVAFATGLLPGEPEGGTTASHATSGPQVETADSPTFTTPLNFSYVAHRSFGAFLDQHEGELVRIDTSVAVKWRQADLAEPAGFRLVASFDETARALHVNATESGRSGFAADEVVCDRWWYMRDEESTTRCGYVTLEGYYLVEQSALRSLATDEVYVITAVD